MKNLKKVLASLLLVCMVCSMLAIPAAADGTGEIEVKLDRYGLPMAIGEVYDLTGSVEPENVGSVNLLWSSSNEAVAAVDANGVVTALALGTADITASTTDGLYSAVCQVVVADPVVYASDISLDMSEFSMDLGGFASLTPTVYPENASVQRVMWLSSDENVLTVDENGVVTALAAGTATVTAFAAELDLKAETLNEALMARCTVYVIDRAAEEAAAAAEAEAARLAEEEAARIAAEQQAAAEAEAARIAAEQQAAAEAEAARIAAEQQAAAEAEAARIAAEQQAAAEAEAARIAAEQQAAAEAEAARIAAEQQAAAEAEAARIAAEQQAAAEAEAAKKAAEDTLVLPTVGVSAVSDPQMSFAALPAAPLTPVELSPLDTGTPPTEKATISVTVNGIPRSDMDLSTTEIGSIYQLTATVSQYDASMPSFTWVSSDESVVTVSTVEGLGSEINNVTVVGAGSATITISRGDTVVPYELPVVVHADAVNIYDELGNAHNGAAVSMNKGESLRFAASGTYGSSKAVTWSSSDSAVVTVTDGTVTAVSAGSATVTATSVDDKANPKASSSIYITVTDPTVAVTGVTLDKTTLALTTGGTDTLAATVSPDNATDKSLNWSTSDPSVATVTDGTVSAVAPGSATITVTTVNGGYTASCAVTVSEPVIAVTGVTLNQTTLSLTPGSNNYASPLVASVAPENASNKKVSWSGSANGISVDANGVVSVAADATVGATATITATTEDGGKTATCTVTVANPAVPVTGVSLDKSSHSLTMGSVESFKLTATVQPSNASNQKLSWSSTNEAAATVDQNGNVTAVAAGTAVIIVSTEDGGKTATCTVTVNPKPAVLVTGIEIAGPGSSTTVGGTLQLSAVVTPDNATNKAVTWSSDNSSIATIDQNGKLTGVNTGTAYITAAAKDGSGISRTVAITVTTAVPGTLYVTPSTNTITAAGGTAYLTARLANNSIVPNASINWTVSPADMATVSANGVVTPKRVGTFTVTGTFSSNGVNYTGSTSIRMMPVIIYGNNASYNGDNNPLYFVVNDLSSNARGVRVDGYTLTHGQHCYIYDHQGYIAVALNPAFLKTLSPSVVHTIQIDSANGTATGYFRIYGYSSAINGVKTGDENQAALWAALLLVSVIGMGAVLISRRKEWNG